MSDSIELRQRELIEEFSIFDDWMDRYSYIIEMAEDLEEYPAEEKDENHLIKGCQSKVWLTAIKEGDRLIFKADSDAIITKGLVAMMIRVLSDADPKEILSTELHFIKAIGLQEHLSPTRSNGLAAMVKQMKIYALAMSGRV